MVVFHINMYKIKFLIHLHPVLRSQTSGRPGFLLREIRSQIVNQVNSDTKVPARLDPKKKRNDAQHRSARRSNCGPLHLSDRSPLSTENLDALTLCELGLGSVS